MRGHQLQDTLHVPSLREFKLRIAPFDGRRLETGVRQLGFVVHVVPEGLAFTPDSTGRVRIENWARIEAVLDQFNEFGSTRSGDYHDLTYNSSYLLALLRAAVLGTTPEEPREEPTRSRPPTTPTVRETAGLEKPHQRVGAISNAHVGREFEGIARRYFDGLGIRLESEFPVEIGLTTKKIHRFDLGCAGAKILVECKSHTWTEGGRVPSAKMTTWNQAMYFFHLAPSYFKKYFFVLHHRRGGDGESLCSYYLRTNAHLVPDDVIFVEWDQDKERLVSESTLAP